MQTDSQAPTTPSADADDNPEFFHLVVEKVRSKGMKYSMVSVVNVVLGQGLLWVLHTPVGLGATKSNAIAVAVSSVPAYYLNRAWVWGRRGKSNFTTEVLPFWGFVVVGLVASTLSVTVAAHFVTNKLVPNIASLCAFGVLWVVRFFILDKMFHKPHADFYEEVVEHIEPGAFDATLDDEAKGRAV